MSDHAVMPYQHYKAACDAVRAKGAGSPSIKSGELASAISSIKSGETPTYDWTPHLVTYGNGYDCCQVVNDGSYPKALVDWFKSEQKMTRTYLLEAYCASSSFPQFVSFPNYMLVSGSYPMDGLTLWSGWGTAASVWSIGENLKVTGTGQVMWIGLIFENVRTYALARKLVFDQPNTKTFTVKPIDVGGISFIRCGGLYDSVHADGYGGRGLWMDVGLNSDDGKLVHAVIRHRWGMSSETVSQNVTTVTNNSCVLFSDRLLI